VWLIADFLPEKQPKVDQLRLHISQNPQKSKKGKSGKAHPYKQE